MADFGFKPKDSALKYTLGIRIQSYSMHGFTNCKITYMQLGYLIISNLPCICCKMLCNKWLISYIHTIRKVIFLFIILCVVCVVVSGLQCLFNSHSMQWSVQNVIMTPTWVILVLSVISMNLWYTRCILACIGIGYTCTQWDTQCVILKHFEW